MKNITSNGIMFNSLINIVKYKNIRQSINNIKIKIQK